MVFSSLNFLLIFLPIVLLLHSVLPFKYKNIVLLAASIIFYAWGEPVYVILMILSIGFNYMSGLVLGELEDPHLRKRQLIFAVAVNLLLLGFFKYAGFLVSMINAILPLKCVQKESQASGKPAELCCIYHDVSSARRRSDR